MEVVNKDTFECAIDLIKNKYNPVCLDFASGTNPGGSWRSKQQGTQEESLCRRSDLGLLLEKQKYPIPRDGLIYLPNVIIKKNFNMEDIKPVKCAVIASELRGISSSTPTYLQSRLQSLYETALHNKHDVIVLGAWGCGAFGESDDDPIILAKEIKKMAQMYNEKIKTVCAVMGKKNFAAFSKI
jgi:uncharacterized protein (TIGR02452 family)